MENIEIITSRIISVWIISIMTFLFFYTDTFVYIQGINSFYIDLIRASHIELKLLQ